MFSVAWKVAGIATVLALVVTALSVNRLSDALHEKSAWRIVGAPNHGKTPEPAELHEAVDHAFRVPVGPPDAELDVWVLDPKRDPPTGTVLVLHGVYDKKRTMVGFGKMLCGSNNQRSVLIDLRGHGHSTGDFLSFGQVESRDMMQVLDVLEQRGLLVPPVSIYGPSFGAAVAIQTAARDPRVENVVAVATFGSLEKIVVPYIDHFHPQIAWALPDSWSHSVVDRANALADVDLRKNDNLKAIRETRARVLI
ncbi:MAG: alpha/beta hydrolase, partial [Myxococcota bacterium]